MHYYIFYTILFIIIHNIRAFAISSPSIYLNQKQKDQINSIIQHPKTPVYIRYKVYHILFSSYKNWAIYQAIQFKKLHKHKCRHIPYSECIYIALKGLYKSIINYNGKHAFISYANLYVKGELYKGITEQQPINLLPKNYLRKKKTMAENKMIHNVYMKPIYLGFDHYIMETNIQNSLFSNGNRVLEKMEYDAKFFDIWEKINQLPHFQRRIFHYKYSYDFHNIRNNKQVAELMACSEECVRKNILKASNSIM